jgi:peroxiredoxin family protein
MLMHQAIKEVLLTDQIQKKENNLPINQMKMMKTIKKEIKKKNQKKWLSMLFKTTTLKMPTCNLLLTQKVKTHLLLTCNCQKREF